MEKTLAEVIRAAIEAKNFSQRYVAKKMHISYQTLNSFVTGRRLPNIEHLKSLAKVVDLDVLEALQLKKTSNRSAELKAINELADKLYSDERNTILKILILIMRNENRDIYS